MVTPRQIATLLGLSAASLGLFMASYQAEDQPIVVWGSPETAVVAEGSPLPVQAALPTVAPSAAPKAANAAKPSAHPLTPAQLAAAAAKAVQETKPAAAAAASAAAAKPVAVTPPAPAQTAVKPAVVPVTNPVQTAVNPAAGQPAQPAAVKPVVSQVGGNRIPASTPERIAALAKHSAGRVDPFVSLALPDAAVSPLPSAPPGPIVQIPMPPGPGPGPKPPQPKATPLPTPGDGMVVTGIITSARESVAIVAADGRSRLVQVGDILPGGIRVVSIRAEGKSVIVSHGGRSARLAVKE